MLSIGFLYSYNFHYPKRDIYLFRTFFHDIVVVGLVFIVIFVVLIFYFRVRVTKMFQRKNSLEVYLMIFPLLFLFVISVPSMLLLQNKGGISVSSEDVYVDASQWFWEYRTRSLPRFMSFLCSACSDKWYKLEPKLPLSLEVGRKRFFFCRKDVLHSFALPSMGVKVDCVPGLLVSLETKILNPGIFYGQCRELCGINHRFMPIEVEVVKKLSAV